MKKLGVDFCRAGGPRGCAGLRRTAPALCGRAFEPPLLSATGGTRASCPSAGAGACPSSVGTGDDVRVAGALLGRFRHFGAGFGFSGFFTRSGASCSHCGYAFSPPLLSKGARPFWTRSFWILRWKSSTLCETRMLGQPFTPADLGRPPFSLFHFADAFSMSFWRRSRARLWFARELPYFCQRSLRFSISACFFSRCTLSWYLEMESSVAGVGATGFVLWGIHTLASSLAFISLSAFCSSVSGTWSSLQFGCGRAGFFAFEKLWSSWLRPRAARSACMRR
mmetsp:Transcript_39278/g.122954  ORF Transcript_39278/g.122954 Transcript_39278/m.122954 type:complete len:280 (+) Transcript_39278:1289-2128(+)